MTDFTEQELKSLASEPPSNKAEDPTGQFPLDGYINKPNTNVQAIGEERNRLKFPGFIEGEPQVAFTDYISSIYPYNQVSRSLTGHVYEVDDTPGNERVLIKHADGAGVELGVDGSITISALTNRIEVTGGEQRITVIGDAKLTYQGNVDMKVAGEFNIDCNEFNVNVKNNKTEVIGGAETKEVFKGVTNSVVGNVANFVTEQVTDTVLGGHQYNVKGNVDYNINGNVGFYSSGEMNITSQDYVNISSDNVTASANNMTIQGGNGVIGGDSVHIKGQEGSFEGSVEAPNFHGNLIGKAKFAALADKATGATTAGSIGASGTASYPTEIAAPSFVEPTTGKVTNYLTKAAGGIRKVKIDIGNYLKDFLDKSKRYDGIATQTMTTRAVRSKLRDPANRNNNTFVSSLVEEGNLCKDFTTPTPTSIGRVVDGESTSFYADRSANLTKNTNQVIFVPRNIVKQFIPDPIYNPLNLGREAITSITAKTKLSPSVSISRFLGTEDPVNIKYIRDEESKRQIAKHLYLQTLILNKIQKDQKEFEGVNLEVTEGIYRPGTGETITPESINDLKSKGRAVVYKAVDSQGNANKSRLFDIAVYLKDNAYFDQLILSYDTIECNHDGSPILTARLIIIMPKLDDSFKGTFRREVSTEFNSNRLSQGELVECLPSSKREQSNPNLVVPNSDEHDLDPKTRSELRSLLIQSADEVGVRLVSGWQQVPARGLRPRGESGRHNTGYAHDISLVIDGRVLQPFASTSDREIVKKFSKAFYDKAFAAGYRPSIGWGSNYMEGIRGHFDIAAGIAKRPNGQVIVQSRWGNYGKAANAPQFLRDIFGY
jgi:hypothetical protein